jgi:hypothetical protein
MTKEDITGHVMAVSATKLAKTPSTALKEEQHSEDKKVDDKSIMVISIGIPHGTVPSNRDHSRLTRLHRRPVIGNRK